MKRLFLPLALLTFAASAAYATPPANGAKINERVFNDCLITTLTTVNNYPAEISFDEGNQVCSGGANLHAWSYSDDGGANAMVLNNGDGFSFSFDARIEGVGTNGEVFSRISPWWSQYADGRINCRIPDGEIACFGGRMPFYSFTVQHGISFARNATISLGMDYNPNGLSAASPGTIQYHVGWNGNTYDSPVFNMDMGNPAEDPPHGLWGILNDARAGGAIQIFEGTGGAGNNLKAIFSNMVFDNSGPVPTQSSSWGQVKALYR